MALPDDYTGNSGAPGEAIQAQVLYPLQSNEIIERTADSSADPREQLAAHMIHLDIPVLPWSSPIAYGPTLWVAA